MSPHYQVNASPITKITSWLKFLGKNLHLMGCASLCAKSEVMLLKGIYVLWQAILFKRNNVHTTSYCSIVLLLKRHFCRYVLNILRLAYIFLFFVNKSVHHEKWCLNCLNMLFTCSRDHYLMFYNGLEYILKDHS